MRIRLGEVSDAQSVARIQVNGWHEAYKGIMAPEHLAKMTVEARTPIWQELLAEGVTFVADTDDGTAGFCSVGPARDEDGDAVVVGEIYALYVEPLQWRIGLGSALTDAGLRWLKNKRFATASLWVLEENAIGRRFYEKFGFRPDGKIQPYQSTGRELQELRYIIGL